MIIISRVLPFFLSSVIFAVTTVINPVFPYMFWKMIIFLVMYWNILVRK